MRRQSWYRRWHTWLGVFVALVAGGIAVPRFFSVRAEKSNYLYGTVVRGDISLQVAATGTLAAVTTVQVGTQVSGTIAELYADFNSEVKKGQLLAKLDPQLFEAQVQQQDANVRTAEATLNDDLASIASLKANVEKAKVDVLDKQRKFQRSKDVFDAGLIPRDDLDTAQAAFDAAVATQKANDAQLESAYARYKADEARLVQAKAGLEYAKTNLGHTVIRSPIAGTIISRSVDRGQTVAASFSSPTLFTIGEDLTKMQVNTNIDEADVGKIKPGMPATFTVDAYPGETFQGKISQVRLAATTVQNVVTYNAIIDVPNPTLKLKPGMTANVKILVEKADGVLQIPNSALRYKPGLSDSEMEQAFKNAGEERFWNLYRNADRPGSLRVPNPGGGAPGMATGFSGAGNKGGGEGRSDSGGSAGRGGRGRRVPVWIASPDRVLTPVVVRLGLTDGVRTQIEDGKLKEGDRIIIGLEGDSTRPAAAASIRPPGFGGPGIPGAGGLRR